MTLTRTYFLVYTVPDEAGIGNTAFDRDRPIATIDDIREIEQQIAAAFGGRRVVLTDWQEFPRVGT